MARQVEAAASLGHHLDALPIGAPGDRYEQEADRTAEQVAGRLESGSGLSAPIQATPTPGPAVQAKGEGGAGTGSAASALTQLPPAVDSGSAASALIQLPPAPGSGRPLEPAVRAPMERAFGSNLGNVRLHTNDRAQQLNQSLYARATTVGRDIYFDQGEYDPGSASGRELLAHELTHVLQQRRGGHRLQRGMQGPKRDRKGKRKAPGVRRRPGPPPIPADPGDSPQRQARIDAGPPTISPPTSATLDAAAAQGVGQGAGPASANQYGQLQVTPPALEYSNFGPAAAQGVGQGAVPASAPPPAPANQYGQLQLAAPSPVYSNFSPAAAQAAGQGAVPASAAANQYGQLQLAAPSPVYSNFGPAAAQGFGQGAVPASAASPSQYESTNSPIGDGPAATPAGEYGQLQLGTAESDYETVSDVLDRDRNDENR